MGKTFEDFTLGTTVTSMGVTVTETHVVQWAGLTLDTYPLHIDAEYAAATEFGQRLVHGPFTFALGVGLMAQTGYAEDAVSAWLGAEELKARAPVFIGDTITLTAEITELRETNDPARGFMRMHYRLHNQRDELVMTYDMLFLVKREGSA